MEKISERELRGSSILKVYETTENNNAIEMIDTLKNSINISLIRVKENVELEMQSFGDAEYELLEFLQNYDMINNSGRDLSYSIVGKQGETNLIIGFAEDTNIVTLRSRDASIELSDLIQEKN